MPHPVEVKQAAEARPVHVAGALVGRFFGDVGHLRVVRNIAQEKAALWQGCV